MLHSFSLVVHLSGFLLTCWNPAEEDMSMLISFRAWVFWARASVTAKFGFLIMVPRAEVLNIYSVLVFHKLETGEVILFIFVSNSVAVTSLVR